MSKKDQEKQLDLGLDAAVIAQLKEEVAYLLERSTRAGTFSMGTPDDEHRHWGKSSNAMVLFAFTGKEPSRYEYPSDPSDLASCFRARKKAPKHLQAKMLPLLRKYTDHVRREWTKRWSESQGELFEEMLFFHKE